MSDNVPTRVALSILSRTTRVDEDTQQQAHRALLENGESSGDNQEPLQQQGEDGELQNLLQYLSACHNMNQAAQTLSGRSCCSEATTLAPEGKLYPKQIVSSPDFMDKQMEIWNLLLADDKCALFRNMFPSMEQVHDGYFSMEPVNGELTLCVFERLGVSKAVLNLLNGVLGDAALSKAVGVAGNIAYRSLGSTVDGAPGSPARHSFSVYSSTECGRTSPIVGIEYRPSDLPMVQEITAALAEDIVPERDVIGQEDEAFTFASASKQVVTATITQLFDRMVKSGVQYGYIYTGEAIIFLEIQDDPSVVRYYVSIPDNDVSGDDESTLHYSAVAQIVAFIIRAMKAGSRLVEWHNKTTNLDIWKSSCSEALFNMPSYLSAPSSSRATSCGDEEMNDVDVEYQHVGDNNENFDEHDDNNNNDNNLGDEDENEEDDEDYLEDEDDMYVAYDIKLEYCQDGRLVPMRDDDLPNARQHGEEGFIDDGKYPYWIDNDQIIVSDIRQRQYCTQECLFGVADGAPLDQACPNYDKHGDEHIGNGEFLNLVQNQLTQTRGVSGCCVSLEQNSSLGAIFKVMIPSHGYTFVAKAVKEENVPRLLREGDTYTRLRGLQGGAVPVYLGIVQLNETFEHANLSYSHFMLLSWAGRPVAEVQPSAAAYGFVNSTRRAYKELHDAGLVHNDVELRNMLYNPQIDRIMLVDFERASIYECHVVEFEYREVSDSKQATVEDVEDEEFGGSSNSDGYTHIHNHIPGHGHGGGLRRVDRCEDLRKAFAVATELELSHAVNIMAPVAKEKRPWRIVWA